MSTVMLAILALIYLGADAPAVMAQEAPAASEHSATAPVGSPTIAQPGEPKHKVSVQLNVNVEDLLRRRDFAHALKLVDEALAQESGNAALLHLHAQINCRSGKLDPCLDDLNRAIELAKEFLPAYQLRANVRLDKGQPQDALADCEAITSLIPEKSEGYDCRGRAHRALRNYPLALADFDDALRKQARFWPALYNKGTVYALQGQAQQAIASYTAALAINDSHDESYAQRGTLRIAAGDVEGARADFVKALALNGRNHTAAVGAQALHVGKALDALAGNR
jgi:tetratricopeptide (TPR) repeat protein